MSNKERQKGLRGQQEVQRILRGAGFDLRTLGAQGDSLAFSAFGTMFHVEVKRQERLRLWDWLAQAQAESMNGAVPIVCFRKSRGEWYACLPLADLVRMGN